MSLCATGLCGVDDSVDVELLTLLSRRYPSAEFGVLFHEGREGTPRYASNAWVEQLAAAAMRSEPPMRLAAHLCGTYCTDILEHGNVEFVKQRLVPLGFGRVQLNPSKVNGVVLQNFEAALKNLRQASNEVKNVIWILQANEETKPLWQQICEDPNPPDNIEFLWDFSCGTGKASMNFMPPPVNGIRCGYAGGLGPKSVVGTLQSLRRGTARGRIIWIDMETKLRSEVDGKDVFDIAKAQAVLKCVENEGWEQDDAFPEEASPPPPLPCNARVSGHPLLAHKVTLLRDRQTPPRDFRQLLREVTFHLGYEATADLTTTNRSDVVSPVGPVPAGKAVRLSQTVGLVPILRGGLGMVDAMLELLPNATVHHIGMFRTAKNVNSKSKPIEYYSRLPKESVCDLVFVLDPLIATSKTAHAAIAKLKGWGAGKIVMLTVCSSYKGLVELNNSYPDVSIYAAAVDSTLRHDGYVFPGMGDAGDRQFGTPAGDPLSKDTYDSVWAGDGQRSPRSPGMRARRSEPAPEMIPPITTVLGKHAAYGNLEDIPEAEADSETATPITTHDGGFGPEPIRMCWGAVRPELRGPVLATSRHPNQKNAIGAHSGGYSIYRALAVVSQNLKDAYMPKLSMTTPVARIGPFSTWHDPRKIVTMDPYGHVTSEGFGPWLQRGFDIRPTIAVTKAHIELPECKDAIRLGRLVPDGIVLTHDGQSFVTKAAIEPVWFLPGIAERFDITEDQLRESIFKETNSMYPELLTRPDLKLFLPPIGGMTVYVWGDVEKIPDESVELTVRVHDECNGSDVFGSDICTCRPYLTHAIEECIKTAQRGGTGVCVYFRKEGRALGEVTKYLVYNMRKRQEGGDTATEYFNCTKEVAGVTDTRFQVLMPDVLHWLGITKIHKFISMSDMKHDAITATGIKIEERVEIPPEMVPKDAHVEIAAKVFAGYHGGATYENAKDAKSLEQVKGREYGNTTQYSESVLEGGGATGTAQGYP